MSSNAIFACPRAFALSIRELSRLAARNEGLGGTLTTFVGAQEEALKNLLGVPRQMAFAAMLPLGEPVKQLTRLKRKLVDEFAVRERWDGPPLET